MYALDCEKKYTDMGVRWNVCDTILNCGKELRRLGMGLNDSIDYGAELLCVARWRKYRAVYKVDNTVSQELFEQAKEMKRDAQLPVELLKNLPYPCIAVQVPSIEHVIRVGEKEELHFFSGNFFITIEQDDLFKCSPVADTFFFTIWDSEDAKQPAFFIPLKEGAVIQDVIDSLIDLCNESRKASGETELQNSILSTEVVFPLYAAQIILYLQSVGSDIVSVPTPKTRKTTGKKSQKPAKVQRVGYRIGATLRQQKKVYESSNTNTNPASHRRSPIAHIRRGHFQGFWTGPRGSKQRKLVVKWVAPTYIRGQQGADTTTVFDVK